MTTEIIDKLYLELAQVTTAVSAKERELLHCIQNIGQVIGCNHVHDTDGRTKLVICADEKFRAMDEVVHWAQAILTALNTGDIQNGSLLHNKLREVMIHYRERVGLTK